jgi:5-methylthioadenosine/S-adenosylhomocysteine deaminase
LKKIVNNFSDAKLLHMHFCEDDLEAHTIKRKYWVHECADVLKSDLAKFKMILAHCVTISDYDINVIKQLNASIALCPISNMKLCCGFAPFAKLIDSKINLCLGTDGVGSNDSLSFFNIMKTLVYIANNITQTANLLNSFKVLQMATYNGAKALGIENITGSLAKNKNADFIILHFNNLATHPINNALDDIVFNASEQNIQYSFIDGKLVIDNYKLVGIDENKLINDMEKFANNLKKQLIDNQKL